MIFLEHAWAAGLIDGEGCIRLTKKLNNNRPSYTLILKVDMTHKATINRLRMIFGCGGDYTHPGNKKQGYIVQWNGVEAYRILKLLLPYLFTKKYEAELGIEYWEKCQNEGGWEKKISNEIQVLREVIYEELKEAKHD